jgi:hypothetical protein
MNNNITIKAVFFMAHLGLTEYFRRNKSAGVTLSARLNSDFYNNPPI